MLGRDLAQEVDEREHSEETARPEPVAERLVRAELAGRNRHTRAAAPGNPYRSFVRGGDDLLVVCRRERGERADSFLRDVDAAKPPVECRAVPEPNASGTAAPGDLRRGEGRHRERRVDDVVEYDRCVQPAPFALRARLEMNGEHPLQGAEEPLAGCMRTRREDPDGRMVSGLLAHGKPILVALSHRI